MSPHGGKRKGAGRKAEGEKRSVNLCAVRTRPSRVAAYKDVARANGVTLTKLVEMVMDVFVAKVQSNEVFVAFDALSEEYVLLDLDAVFAEYVKQTKRKGKKS